MSTIISLQIPRHSRIPIIPSSNFSNPFPVHLISVRTSISTRYGLISLITCSVLDIWFIVLTFQKPIFRCCFAVKIVPGACGGRYLGRGGGGDASEAVVGVSVAGVFPLRVAPRGPGCGLQTHSPTLLI